MDLVQSPRKSRGDNENNDSINDTMNDTINKETIIANTLDHQNNDDNNDNDNHIITNDDEITTTSNTINATTTNTTDIINDKINLERSLREKLLARAMSSLESKKTKHVRIDNFQRPFTLNQLKEFLQDLLHCTIDNIWLHSIKTHCYITFDNDIDAMNCISKIRTFQIRFPSTAPQLLLANFTNVGTDEAPTSLEADAAPNLWKEISKMKATMCKPQLLYSTVDEAIVKKRREEKGKA